LRRTSEGPVNEVNAVLVAQERGIRLAEIKRGRGENFVASVQVSARGSSFEHSVRGTVFHVGESSEPRMVQVDNFLVEVVPEGRILLIRNEDRPGVIGAVGTLIGGRGINVSRMQVGLDRQRGEALMLWNVDGPISEALLAEIRRIANIKSATEVAL
jgi:D-3-phosphoglycerate dehydrogenase